MANMLTRIGFIDETSLKTNMAKTTGWAPRGERLIDHAPFGHWQTQTFIAALRHDRLDAPWVIDGPINRDLFDLYIATQLAPTLQPGDVIILDNLSSHKSPSTNMRQDQSVREKGKPARQPICATKPLRRLFAIDLGQRPISCRCKQRCRDDRVRCGIKGCNE